jgi:hypothetical protein
MRLFSSITVLALGGMLGSCNSIDIPPAPDLQPVLEAYLNPTAIVGSEIMSAVADEIAEAAKEIEDSEFFVEILEVIIEVQKELEAATDESGDLILGGTCDGGTNDGSSCSKDSDCPEGSCVGGAAFPSPTAVIHVNYICPGWDEGQFEEGYEAEPDPANGSINLTMTLDSGGIGRVAWGTADSCLYLVPGDGEFFRASYDGAVAVDLGDDVPLDEDIAELLVTFVVEGNIGFDGDEFRINQSFRIILADSEGLELLVDVGEPALDETFNYFFQGTTQGLRDATGILGCSLEESRCFDESGTLFSW